MAKVEKNRMPEGMKPIPAGTPGAQHLTASVEGALEVAEQIYADSLVHMALGPFVSKFSIGRLDPRTQLVQGASTITMPTNALIELVRNLSLAIESDGLISNLEANYGALIDRMKAEGGDQ